MAENMAGWPKLMQLASDAYSDSANLHAAKKRIKKCMARQIAIK
jgi:hypothetical protein